MVVRLIHDRDNSYLEYNPDNLPTRPEDILRSPFWSHFEEQASLMRGSTDIAASPEINVDFVEVIAAFVSKRPWLKDDESWKEQVRDLLALGVSPDALHKALTSYIDRLPYEQKMKGRGFSTMDSELLVLYKAIFAGKVKVEDIPHARLREIYKRMLADAHQFHLNEAVEYAVWLFREPDFFESFLPVFARMDAGEMKCSLLDLFLELQDMEIEVTADNVILLDRLRASLENEIGSVCAVVEEVLGEGFPVTDTGWAEYNKQIVGISAGTFGFLVKIYEQMNTTVNWPDSTDLSIVQGGFAAFGWRNYFRAQDINRNF